MEDKIEQYCLLAKGARGLALVDLIRNATGEPSLFAFGEILDVESVKGVRLHLLKQSANLSCSAAFIPLFPAAPMSRTKLLAGRVPTGPDKY